MLIAKFTRAFIFIVAGILFTSLVSAPLHAQDARPTNTDLKFHKFVPPTPPENNAAASSARQATTPDAVNAAATQQIQLLLQEKSARTPAQQKIDSNVLYTIRMMRGDQAAPGFQSLYTGVDLDDQNRIVVDIVADVTLDLLQKLQSAGALVLDSHPEYRAIRAIVPPNQIETLAALSDVSFIGRKVQAFTAALKLEPKNYVMRSETFAPGFQERAAKVRSQIAAYLQQQRADANSTTGVINTGQGSVTTEGDATHLAARARGVFGITGSGLKIGVLSDSANRTGAATAAQATGDLPPTCPGPGGPCLTILQDFFGDSADEGTAMMEIIYDMAPGASLYFATAANSESGFAANITALQAAGCNIIVDDVAYPDEPVFQDGMVAQAVISATSAGVLYFSSAGNEGNLDAGTAGYFEGDFNDVGSPVFPNGAKTGTLHNFGGSASGDQITNPGEEYILQWADPFGASTNDYDLFYVNSAGLVIASSTNSQTGLQNPVEFIDPPANANPGDRLLVFKATTANPRLFALKAFRGTLSVATPGETWGHSAVTAAFSVAAAPAAAAFNGVAPVGPFPDPFSTGSQLEPFTSDGPRRIIFNPDGSAITPGNFSSTGGTVRNKPDITAADGVSTTLPIGSGLNPFYGTSAAAPHAASVAALIMSAKPALTPAQIRTTLTSTALDIMTPGFDRDSGNGIVMAYPALNSLGLTPAANPEILSVTANENPGNGNGIIDPGEGASISIQLKNPFGVVNATGITGVLTTTTPGVIINQPAVSAFPDIVAGSGIGSNLTPFTFMVASNVPCALNIQFTLTLTYTGGPAPTKALNFSVQTGMFNVSNTLGNAAPGGLPAGVIFATGSQTNRLSRNGVAQLCANNESFPGIIAAGSRIFDSYSFPSTRNGCTSISLTSPDGADLFTSIYQPNFTPSNINQGYLGDAGNSGSPQGFSFFAFSSDTYTIVVNDSSPNGTAAGKNYTLQIPACLITNPNTINHFPVALAHDVTVTATTVGGTANASINNNSFDPDAGDTLTLTQTPPGPYHIGVTNVVLKVVDSKGASSQASANVTVLDDAPDLAITPTHTGFLDFPNFAQGDVGDHFTMNVINIGGASTNGLITVVDTLPAGVTATAIDASQPFVCTLATLTCTLSAPMISQEDLLIIITVNVAPNAPSLITNSVTVSGGGDANLTNNTSTDPTVVLLAPDLTISESHTGNFTQGQVGATYSIVVGDVGGTQARAAVTVVDTPPAGLTVTAMSGNVPGSGWQCTLATFTCIGSNLLSAGGTLSPLIVTVNVASNAPATLANVVTVSGGGEFNTANDVASDLTTILTAADLTVSSTHLGNFSQGQTGATYSLTASNVSAGQTSGTVTVADTLPTGLTATLMTGIGWACTAATATCTRSDVLGPSASYPAITLTVNVSLAAPASVTNSVTVSGGGEINPANDTATDLTTVTVASPDLTISSTHSGNFTQGQIGGSYNILATNGGAVSTAGTVTVVDNLPAGLSATAMIGTGWTCTVATVTCTRNDTLAAASSYPAITLTVNVSSNATNLVNIATVSGGGETNTANDSTSDPTTIVPVADLTITKSHTGNFTQGQIGAAYTITVSNLGPGPTNGTVTVLDALPPGLTATSIAGTGWACTVGTLTCTRNDVLAAGSSYPAITLTVTVASNAASSVTNTASVSGGGELNTANDTATDITTITVPADLTITKTHSGNFTQGQNGGFAGGPAYTITVTNSGSVATTIATNVTVVDALPPSLTAVSMLGTNWLCTLATLTCVEHDQLAPGASYPPITLTVGVSATAPASVTNTATVSGGGEVNTTNDTATDVTAITQLGDLTIGAAIAPPGFFLKGQTGAQFAFNVTNSGAGPTSGTVTVVGTLPADLTPTAIAGTGWTCTLGTLTCTRADVLPAGQIYPSILVTMNVSATAPATVSTTATVSGGGEIIVNNDVLTFNTQITSPPAVSLSVTSLSFPNQGVNTTSASKQITVTNTGGQTLVFPGLFATVLSNSANWAIAPGTTCANGVSVLGGGGICVINITFTPTAVGSVGPDTLTLNNNATPSHQDITLTGTGIDFATGGPTSPVTITAGQTANFTITITPGTGGFANPVTFSATGLPAASSGSFNPSSFTPGSTATSTTLSITTTARGMLPPVTRPNLKTPPQFVLWIVSLISILFTLVATRFVFTRKRQLRFAPAILIVTVLLTATIIAGCGGGGVTNPPPPTGTPAGTYPITVTAQSGNLIHTVTVTLTVQ